jgi:hypothetical protein
VIKSGSGTVAGTVMHSGSDSDKAKSYGSCGSSSGYGSTALMRAQLLRAQLYG